LYNALIMAGGSGTRLWPLSRELRPKQTLKLVGKRSLFQHSVDRLQPLFALENIWVVTRQDHTGMLQEQIPELPKENYIIEPEGRGTAPAIGLAAIYLYRRDPEAIMAVLTADHYIADVEKFRRALAAAEKAARQGYLVTMGIHPTAPSTAFGYIEQGQRIDPIDGFEFFQVRQFTEKPARETAARMVSSGIYAWNSGMFIWQVKRILEELYRQMPEFYEQLMEVDQAIATQSYEEVIGRVWPKVARQTIDYGVMEGAERVVVIPVEMGWTDVGSWSSLFGLLPEDEEGNIIEGPFEGIDVQNNLVIGDKRLIAAIGVKDLVIVDTEDALLVCSRGQEQQVKEMVERLRKNGRSGLL
jgi:mannose-1-phosphate guanylyltransferase